MTPDDIANFLDKIGLSQYSDTIKDEDISGDVLLDILEDLSQIGVDSPLHQMKIMQLFPRELLGTKAKYSNNHLSEFLKEQKKIGEYIPILKEHGIDGDMILNVKVELMKKVLIEIGVTPLDATKICSKYKTNVSKLCK